MSRRLILSLLTSLFYFVTNGQAIIDNLATGASLPTGWSGTNNVSANPIQQSGYYLVENNGSNDFVTSDIYDLSSYSSVTIDVSIATYGASSATFLGAQINTGTGWSSTSNSAGSVSNTTYINTTISFSGPFTSTTQFRFLDPASGVPSVRIKNIVIKGYCTNPTISTHPSNASVTAPATANFSVTASGSSLTYQWQVSTNGGSTWANVVSGSGGTTASYTTPATTTSMNNYQYRLIVSSGACSTTSNAAILSVAGASCTNPVITTHPASQTTSVGSGVTFTGAATGTNLSYQWQLSTDNGATFTNIPGALSANYNTGATTISMNGNQYRLLVFSDGACQVNTTAATLTVNPPPLSTCINEGFESAFPASGWLQTNVTQSNATSDVAVGTQAVTFSSNSGSLTTTNISYPNTLTFYLGRSSNTSAKTFTVSISTTSSTTGFTAIGTYNHSNVPASSYNQYSIDLSAYSTSPNAWIKFEKTSSTTSPWRLDQVVVTCGMATPCTTPTAQPTALTFGPLNAITNNSIGGSFTAASPAAHKYLVVRSIGAFTGTLVNGTVYNVNDVIGNGTVVDNDNVPAFTATGLASGTVYTFTVFSYNATNCSVAKYNTSSPLVGTQTTRPDLITNFKVTCQNGTTATLTWTNPANKDGIIILARNSTNAPTLPESTIFPSAITANSAFGTAGTEVGTATPTTYAVHKSPNGTSVTVTGLTPGQPYKFLAVAYKNNNYSSTSNPIATITSLGISEVNSLNGIVGSGSLSISWSNPAAGCFSQIMVVVNEGAVTLSPSGDGSAYTANSVYNAVAAVDQVVYKGTGNSVNVTGLTNGKNYCVKVFVRNGTNWSNGISNCYNILNTTTFNTGELFFTGFDPTIGGSGDEYLVATLVDIVPGTKFSIVNSRYEAGAAANERTNKWGGPGDDASTKPGIMEVTWNGPGNIAAGTVIDIENTLSPTAIGPYTATPPLDIYLITPSGVSLSSGFTVTVPAGSTAPNISSGSPDQIFLVQGTFYDDGSPATPNEANYYLNGRALFGITNGTDWVPFNTANSGMNTTAPGTEIYRRSRLPNDVACFNMANASTTYDKYAYYRNSALHVGTKREIISELSKTTTSTIWFIGNATSGFDLDIAVSTLYAESGAPFNVTGNVEPGAWVGDKNNNWFDCANWGGLVVPDENTNVFLDNSIITVGYNARINSADALAPQYNSVAKAKTLTINATGKVVEVFSNVNDRLQVYKDIILENGILRGGSGTIGLQGDMVLNGGTFNPESGTFVYNSNSANQNIAPVNYYNLVFDSLGQRIAPSGTIQISKNLTGLMSTTFIHNNGTIEMLGSTASTYSATNPFTFYNFKHGNTSGLTIGSTMAVLNEFATGNSAKINVNNNITLKSSPTLTASVSAIPTSAAFTYGAGKFEVERYIGQYRKWQLLSPNTYGETFRQSWQENGAIVAGYGTKITYPGGGGGTDGHSHAPSLKFYDPSTDDFTGIGNTMQLNSLKPGYFIFNYGDRNGGTTTTLRTRGKLYSNSGTGNQAMPAQTIAAGMWDVVGNKFASRIGISNFLSANPGLVNSIKVWDPALTGTYWSGAYQTITSSGIVTPGGTGYYNGTESNIESGQAFFVQAGSSAVSINFNENQKVSGSRLVMKEASDETMFNTMLYRNNVLMDGVRILMDQQYNADIDLQDAEKKMNSSENIGILHGSKQYTVEFRKPFVITDTVHLRIGNFANDNYSLGFSMQNLNSSLLSAYLVDNFTNEHIDISLTDSSSYSFTSTADAASKATDRFMIVFQRTETGKIISIDAVRNSDKDLVTFTLNNEVGVQDYAVEGSENGQAFSLVQGLDANGNLSYSAIETILPTETKWYRVRVNYADGSFAYSEKVKVEGSHSQQIFIAENPVKAGLLTLVFENMPTQKYPLQIINASGQIVYNSTITVNNSYTVEKVKLGALPPGAYIAKVNYKAIKFMVK